MNLIRSSLHSLHQRKIMDIQQSLTYFINTFVLSSIIFFLLDFCFYLFNSWQQLNPSTQPDFYQQVKDLLGDDDINLAPSNT